ELAERRDDAEDGAEEADERRVVAEGAEEQQARLEALPARPDGAREDLLDGVGALVVPVEGLDDDGRLDRRARNEHLARRADVPLPEEAAQLVGELVDVDAAAPEEPPALDDDADGDHRQREEDVEDR